MVGHDDTYTETITVNTYETDSNGGGFVLEAVLANNSSLITQLLRSDKVDAKELLARRDANGQALLYIAAEKRCYGELVILLIRSGADVSQEALTGEDQVPPFSLDRYTTAAPREAPIHLAARTGDSALLTILLDNGADKNMTDSLHRTPMILAASNSRMECARLLVLAGADVTVRDVYDKTALHLALDIGNDDIATTITHNGGDLTVRYHYKPRGVVVGPSLMSDLGVEQNELELLSKLDRYGNIQSDQEAQQQHARNMREQMLRQKKEEKEMARAQKWNKMMARWSPDGRQPSKLKERARKGIPDRVRGRAWCLMAQTDSVYKLHPSLFDNLVDQTSKSELVIDLDVNRASRNHIYFRERYGIGQVILFNVLKVYSNYDEEIGYTQGMSSIAALLVMYMPEQMAFWTLERLMNKPEYGMRQLFLPGLPRLHQMIYVFDHLMDLYLPEVYKHFNELNLGSVIFATKWFIIGYLDTFPLPILLRVWDLIFSEGYNIVYAVALTILKMNEKQLVKKSFEECFTVFNGIEDMNIDEDVFVAQIIKNKVSKKKIASLEKSYVMSLNAGPPTRQTKKSRSRFSMRPGK
eukprot:gene7641-8940_t